MRHEEFGIIPGPEPGYRPLADQAKRAAEYRTNWIAGKVMLFLAIVTTFIVVQGVVATSRLASPDRPMWWMYAIPLGLLMLLFKPGFPASFRCPSCRKKMATRQIAGEIHGSVRRYLVCVGCKLSIYLGESRLREGGD